MHHNTEFGHPRTFVTNSVTTAKYNPVTFLPRFLVEVFSQVAYFYFLVQVRSTELGLCSGVAVRVTATLISHLCHVACVVCMSMTTVRW